MRPNEVNTEVQYDCKVRHQAVIFLYTEVQNMRKNMTEIVFILDRSGSMSGLEKDTIGGFNSMIEKQKKENGEALISTVLFDNVSEVIHDRVPVQKVISDGSGQCLICNFQIFVKFIFFQIQKCISKLTDFIVISVNVTATHARKRCRLFLESSL